MVRWGLGGGGMFGQPLCKTRMSLCFKKTVVKLYTSHIFKMETVGSEPVLKLDSTC